MKLYSAKVRLSGSIWNEVPVANVTAAEIEILRIIHGGDESVHSVVATGEDKSTSKDVRDLLSVKYGNSLAGHKKTFESIFGARTVPLPDEPYGFQAAEAPAKPRKVKEPAAVAQTEEAPVITPGSVVTSELIAQQLESEFN